LENIGAKIVWSKILSEFKCRNCPDEIIPTDSNGKNQALVSEQCSDIGTSTSEKSFFSEFTDFVALYISKVSSQIKDQGENESLELSIDEPSLLTTLYIKDFDWWYSGFRKHGYSRTGPWGFVVSNVRQDYCDDSSTCVFRGIRAQNEVVVCLFAVDFDVYKNFHKQANCRRLRNTLGENDKTAETKLMKAFLQLQAD